MDAGRRDARAGDAQDMPEDAPSFDTGPFDAGRDARVDAGRDAGRDAPFDAGFDAGPPLCPATVDRIAIVEVMISSRSGAGDRGEWIEIYNAGDCFVDLGMAELLSPNTSGTPIVWSFPPGTVIAPMGRLVLAQSTVAAENHDLMYDLSYSTSGIVLDNGGDSVSIRVPGTMLDTVSWGATDYVHGAARSFPDTLPITMNDSQARWCNATATYSTATGGPYRGTPRMANGSCP
jgi:hypothetical protein